MIYANEQRAIEVAAMLNNWRRGYGRYRAELTRQGWTVVVRWN